MACERRGSSAQAAPPPANDASIDGAPIHCEGNQCSAAGDLLFTLQLWGLHWLRLHLAGAAFVLSLFNWNARRPARG